MNVTREAISAALFALGVAAVPGGTFKTTARRLEGWDDVDTSMQPAFFQAKVGETAKRQLKLPAIWELRFDWYVYARAPRADNAIPDQVMNPILDALVAALGPSPTTTLLGQPQTLGGLVQYAWVEGEIKTDEGVLGDQCVAIIPIIVQTTD